MILEPARKSSAKVLDHPRILRAMSCNLTVDVGPTPRLVENPLQNSLAIPSTASSRTCPSVRTLISEQDTPWLYCQDADMCRDWSRRRNLKRITIS